MERRVLISIMALVAIIAIAAILRSVPFFKYSHYGIWLQYDDSMFEYWLSKTLYRHGLLYWYDLTPSVTKYLWWWPQGRDVRKTESPGLAFTGAGLYPLTKLFGLRLVDWVGLVPAFYGTLATISSAALGWIIGGPPLAIATALSVGYQYAFMQRSIASFVEKMAPCLFFGTLFLVFLSLTNKSWKTIDRKRLVMLAFLGGLSLMMAAAFWGGFLMFVGIMIITVVLAPLLISDKNYYISMAVFIAVTAVTFMLSSLWITTIWMHRIWLMVLLTFTLAIFIDVLALYVLQRYDFEKARRVWVLLIIAVTLVLVLIVQHPFVLHKLLPARYIMMIMPWIRGEESALARSIAEHQGIFNVYGANDLVNLFGIGIAAPLALLIALYLAYQGKREEVITTLPIVALGLFATYLILANASVYLLTPLGYLTALAGALALYWTIEGTKSRSVMRYLWGSLAALLIVLLIVGDVTGVKFALNYPPPSFLSAGTPFYSPLFPKAMNVIAKNCKFALAWWDYGYMIGATAHATTVVDPATLNTTKIAMVAKALTSSETNVIKIMKDFKMPLKESCVFTYEVFPVVRNNVVVLAPQSGDFAKSVWMFRIAGFSDKVIFSKFIRVKYLVVGITASGKEVVLVVNNIKDIRTTPEGIVVTVPGRGTFLLTKVLSISTRPIYDIRDVFIYTAIYDALRKAGFNVVDSLGRPVNVNVTFKHFKVIPVVARLYIPNTDKTLPYVGIAAILKYVG